MQERLSQMTLVLASSSPYRQELLARLGLPFRTARPDIDESRRGAETPLQLVRRLSAEKARAIAGGVRNALVIGSDQVAILDGQILGKPGNRENAFRQLGQASGRRVRFLTGLCLINSDTDAQELDVVPFDVIFRSLTAEMIDRYLDRETPYNCAGSFKSEGLGIALFDTLEGSDPSALMGLPLIRLIRMLEDQGMAVL